MTTATNRWLDRLAALEKSRGGSDSDYRLAQLLGVERQVVSRYRRELDQMGPDAALKVAEQLEVHPRIVVGEVMAERARTDRERRYWLAEIKSAAKKAAMAGAAILTALSGPALSGRALLDCILCQVDTASNDDGFPSKKPAPTYRPGRIVTLSNLTGTEPPRVAL